MVVIFFLLFITITAFSCSSHKYVPIPRKKLRYIDKEKSNLILIINNKKDGL